MFYRKIEETINVHLDSDSDKILLIDGARQIGKTFIIRHVGEKKYTHFIEINMLEDKRGAKLFSNVSSTEEFYLQLSAFAGADLGSKDDTLVFIDEIQAYPQLLTLLKFLRQDGRYTYIASGSMLGIALRKTVSVPIGSISVKHMYPMDFEEFLLAYGVGRDVIGRMRESFENCTNLPAAVHERMLQMFKYYLMTGGLPDAIKAFIERQNVAEMRSIQEETHGFYAVDASQYDKDNKLRIRSIYESIPSLMENKKKRLVAKDIESKKGATFERYKDEFDYLTASGIALDVKAVSTPVFPLNQGLSKNLLKLYLNDVGLLTAILYGNNINAILNDELSINLGSVYETAVAMELKAHGFNLFYYDNRKKGEVDFLIDDYKSLSVLPIEVKSGKDYNLHASLDRFLSNKDYSVKRAYVFSNSGELKKEGNVIYLPVYMCMFVETDDSQAAAIKFESPLTMSDWE